MSLCPSLSKIWTLGPRLEQLNLTRTPSDRVGKLKFPGSRRKKERKSRLLWLAPLHKSKARRHGSCWDLKS